MSRSLYRNSYLSYFLMYLFWYLAWALSSQLISVYLLGRGFSAAQASLVVSGAALATMAAQPLIGAAGDRYDIKRVNYVLFGLTIVGAVLFVLSSSFVAALLSFGLLMALMNGANPVMERVATASPYPYGKIRIWGTIGYAAGTWMAGLLYDLVAPEAIYLALVCSMVLCMAGLYGTEPQFKEAQAQDAPVEKPSARTLLSNQSFLLYVAFMALRAGSLAAPNTYFPAFLTSAGMDTSVVSTILSVAVVCELPLVLFAGLFMDRVANKALLVAGFAASLAQLVSYGFMLPQPVQLVLTLVGKHPAGMLLIMANLKVVHTIVDSRQQLTALALVSTTQNLATMVMNPLSGVVLDAGGYQPMFLLNLGVMLVAFVLMMAFRIKDGNGSNLFA